jgi:hypothetical protein
MLTLVTKLPVNVAVPVAVRGDVADSIAYSCVTSFDDKARL